MSSGVTSDPGPGTTGGSLTAATVKPTVSEKQAPAQLDDGGARSRWDQQRGCERVTIDVGSVDEERGRRVFGHGRDRDRHDRRVIDGDYRDRDCVGHTGTALITDLDGEGVDTVEVGGRGVGEGSASLREDETFCRDADERDGGEAGVAIGIEHAREHIDCTGGVLTDRTFDLEKSGWVVHRGNGDRQHGGVAFANS